MVIAQAVIERAVLDSGRSGISMFFDRINYYASQVSAPWLIAGLVLLLVWILFRRR